MLGWLELACPTALAYLSKFIAGILSRTLSAEELRADINWVLRSSHSPKPNLNKVEAQALKELKRDRDRLVLTADNGVAMVIMDRQDYINKSNKLLTQQAYRAIPWDPINRIN